MGLCLVSVICARLALVEPGLVLAATACGACGPGSGLVVGFASVSIQWGGAHSALMVGMMQLSILLIFLPGCLCWLCDLMREAPVLSGVQLSPV